MIFEKIISLFKKPESCDCPWSPDDDTLSGTTFKHCRNGKIYRYLFSAMDRSGIKETMVVVYQDVESKKRYTRQWNNFFSSTKVDGKDVPRFEEQT